MQRESILDRPLSAVLRLDREKALYVLLILLALLTRLWGLGDRVMSHDESLHTKYSWDLYRGQGFIHTPMMHGPLLFHAAALSFFLFGDNDFTARLPVALIGVVIVASPYFLRRWLGRTGALVASLLFLISPSIAFHSRYIRHDIPVILWSLIVVASLFHYLHDGRERWLYTMAAGVSLMFTTMETAFIYSAIFGLFLVGLFLFRALADPWPRPEMRFYFLRCLAMVGVGLVVFALGLMWPQWSRPAPEQGGALIPTWWGIVGALVGLLALLAAIGFLLYGLGRQVHRYRSFDLIILLGTFCLPLLSPLLIKLAGLNPLDYTTPGMWYSAAILAPVLLLSLVIGLTWDWRRWLIAAAIYYAIFVVLFTTVFTNGGGFASGMIGSLGYWLEQHGVRRGGQPWYYYLLMLSLYDYLPLVGALAAASCFGWLRWIARLTGRDAVPGLRLFVPFLLWWITLTWVGYSYAGEKMPWLSTHFAVPMILATGWVVGRLIEGVDWPAALRRRAWLLVPLVPGFVAALAALVTSIGSGPFAGVTLAQLQTTGKFLSALVGTLGLGAVLVYLVRRAGLRLAGRACLVLVVGFLVLLTVRTAWTFCYIYYDLALEFLVYAHAAPGVKTVMAEIEELSRRVGGGPRLIQVAYGADGSWPFSWYLRNYPNAVFYGTTPSREQLDVPLIIAGRDEWSKVEPYLGDNYYVFNHTYLWWPMQDYFNLSLERVRFALTDPAMRAAVWDIIFNRDYRRYDQVTGKKHTLDEWPLRNDFRFYVRRDIADQVWDLGLGPAVAEELPPIEVDPYEAGWRDLAAVLLWGSEGTAEGQLMGPRGLAIAPDGSVYVADTGNHRIQRFDAHGQFLGRWGGFGASEEGALGQPGAFNEPWGLAVGPDGSVYVADTWNHRVQKFDAQGGFLTAWGVFGQFDVESVLGQAAFYGPRAVAVGPDGRVYVADTGNKRIQVFDADGNFLSQWGGGGVIPGRMDEPVGVAVDAEGQVYVADTWNRRVQVFTGGGTFVRQWPVSTWKTGSAEEKPYLALDREGRVYVTDPEGYRVLVFDGEGNYLASFGQFGFDERSFALPTGIAVSQDGLIYVTDARSGRVLVFPALDFGE